MSHFDSLGRNSFKYYAIFVILSLQGCQFEAKRFLDIYATLISYTVPKENEAILQINCSLTSVVNTRMQGNSTAMSKLKTHPAMFFSTKFAYDIKDIQAHVNISIERSGHYDKYLTIAIDICEARYAKVEQPFVRYLRDEIVRLMKPIADCPAKKNILYEMNNLMLSNKFLGAYWPPLNWKADAQFWLNGRYSVALVVAGKIEWINI